MQAPEEQVILFEEATTDPKSSWRAGVNCYPSATKMELCVPSLFQRELDSNQLHIEDRLKRGRLRRRRPARRVNVVGHLEQTEEGTCVAERGDRLEWKRKC